MMKLFFCLAIIAFGLPFSAYSQNDKELLVLACPFDKGTGREPKEAFTWDPQDLKVIMISHADTAVRSSIGGTVSNVQVTEEGHYEIVIYYKDYYFWYYGIKKPFVKKGQKVNARQFIGSYEKGIEMELRLFRDETPVDPRSMLECKILKAGE